MKRMFRNLCRAGWLPLLLFLAANASGQVTVKSIQVKHLGPPAASDELVKATIRVKQGETFSRAAVDDDVRNLYATGFFYNIRVAEDAAADGIALTYVLQSKPRITEIKFTGNKEYSENKLRKTISSKVGEPLDERTLFQDTQAIKEKYQKSGYQKTTVKYVLNIDENAGRGTVTFEVGETPKVKIVDVIFDNAQAFTQKQLRKSIKTRRTWFFAWITGDGKLKDEQLEDDKDKLAEFYHDAGYIDFELKDIKYDYPTTNKLILHFVVSEGRRYKVGDVGFKGVTLFPTNDIAKTLKMKSGQTFTPKGLNKDVEAVQDFYGAKGYIDAKVLPRKSPNVDTGNMDLCYELLEGDKSYIEKIEIKGNVKTKDKVIRRELSVSPGEVFDMVRVKRSKARLEQMNYFERVDTRPEDTDMPNRKNLVVGVEEKNTGNFTIGAGFSSVDSLVGFVELAQGNFDLFKPPHFQGGGQKFRLRVAVGLERQDYVVTFVEPWFLDRKLTLGVDLYHRNWNFLSDLYDETRTGARVSLTRALGSDFLIGTVAVTAENVGIKNVSSDATPTILDSQGNWFVGRFNSSIAYDTRNSVMLPNKGQRTELFGEITGGDFCIYKAEAKTAWYFPGFFQGHIWEVIGKIGVMDCLGAGIDNSNSELGLNKVPFFERYFLGGAYSLRGFRYRDVGPHENKIDGDGREPIGGNSYYMASVEYSLPVVDRLRLAAFYDMGNVYYNSYQFDFGTFSANVGMGIRLNLPIGPLRLDYGIPVREANGETTSGRFNFSAGYTREF